MLAAEEMGHKGVRAMSPLDNTLANALRLKLGKGRELPEEVKPKRVVRPRPAKPAEGEAAGAKRPTLRGKRKGEEPVPGSQEGQDLRPAATIVRPRPVTESPEGLLPE